MGFFDFLTGGTKVSTATSESYTLLKQLNMLQDTYGTGVNQHTAMRISAVYNAVNLISESIAKVALEVRQKKDKGDVPATNHPVYNLLNHRPNSRQTSFVWRQAVQGQVLLRGNGYSVINRNNGGQPISITYYEADQVQVVLEDDSKPDSDVMYFVNGSKSPLLKEDVIWIPAFTYNGYEGVSPIRYHKETLGGALAAIGYNADYYRKGGFFKGILKIMGKIGSVDKTPAQRAKEISQQFDKQYQDGSTPVIYDGSEYIPVNMTHRDLQYVDNAKMTVEDIARIFNVPLSKLKRLDNAIQSNIEAQQLEFVTDTLMPWFEKWENELTDKLLTPRERALGYHIAFNDKELLRGDMASRADYYNKLFYLGSLSPNDIRKAEGLTDREGGDQYFTAVNLLTDEQVGLQSEKMKKELESNDTTDAFAPANSDME